jgi:hypothetical protein
MKKIKGLFGMLFKSINPIEEIISSVTSLLPPNLSLHIQIKYYFKCCKFVSN